MSSRSQQLFDLALQSLPGGVDSPVRAFQGVGGTPIFFKRGEGAYLTDVDDRRYVDYVNTWGATLLGHASPAVLQAVRRTAENGLGFGAPHALEAELAGQIRTHLPTLEKLRLVNSGTEATMSAIRLARGFTRRDKIIKFEGCYHGHADALLVKAGSGALTFGVPSSAGVPADLAAHTLVATYNDLDTVAALFERWGHAIAAVIVEPVAANMNCVLPVEGFLPGLRDLCDHHGSLLIFDEVITGFRVGLSGAQGLFGVRPDLTTLGKIIGGGLPVGAFGGRAEVMDQLAPMGSVYQAGTLSGNPVAAAAGLAVLRALAEAGVYDRLAKTTARLVNGLAERARAARVPLQAVHLGGLFGLLFIDPDAPVTNYSAVARCDIARFRRFFHAMLERGVYLAPSAFEAGFLTLAHGEPEIEHTLRAAEEAFGTMRTV